MNIYINRSCSYKKKFISFFFVFLLMLVSNAHASNEIIEYDILDSISTSLKLSQNLEVKGVVTDANGMPVPGVNILVKGTSIGAISDFDGNYMVSNVPENATLEFSYIGFLKQSVPVNGQRIINIVLHVTAESLDEIVVVGYGTQKKSDVTGAISIVDIETFDKTISPFASQALQGLVSGVNVTSNTGAPGDIYSEYPNYEYAIEPSEGFTAVDDVSRAIIMLSKYIEVFGHSDIALEKMKNLTEFILQMQNPNGYFNNFLWNDLTINTTYQTSVAEINWWSFRALWALETAYPLLINDAEIANRILLASQMVVTNIKADLPTNNVSTQFINGIEVPTWLPGNSAADQSAVLVLGLLKHYNRTSDNDTRILIDRLAMGMMLMQKGDADNYPFGAFLSFENLWHAWGNSQSYALLKVGQSFNNQDYIDSALLEIENFYPYLIQNGFAKAFWISTTGDDFFETNRNTYPQIAYGVRPMLWAASEAYQQTNNGDYASIVGQLEQWILGQNDANTAIYNAGSGICFDGITGRNQVNRNSGAESTLETLLMLLEIEKLN